MNLLLQINKKFIIYLLLILSIFTTWLIYTKTYTYNEKLNTELNKISKYDITNPKFTINNNKNDIIISANEGNFINETKILLKNKVSFKSNKFTIKSSEVFFDKSQQTAYTNNDSIFSSSGTKIMSEGFAIKDSGNKIIFNGKTSLKLSND